MPESTHHIRVERLAENRHFHVYRDDLRLATFTHLKAKGKPVEHCYETSCGYAMLPSWNGEDHYQWQPGRIWGKMVRYPAQNGVPNFPGNRYRNAGLAEADKL